VTRVLFEEHPVWGDMHERPHVGSVMPPIPLRAVEIERWEVFKCGANISILCGLDFDEAVSPGPDNGMHPVRHRAIGATSEAREARPVLTNDLEGRVRVGVSGHIDLLGIGGACE
jgi:hypothetical protein